METDNKVFATTQDQRYNVGIFIGIIVEIMKEYKKKGKFREYYENGDLKYEGNFKDDEYNDDYGQFYFENGECYIGQFKQGKKQRKGFILDKNQNIFLRKMLNMRMIFILIKKSQMIKSPWITRMTIN
mgnify:CR=1 FL=1